MATLNPTRADGWTNNILFGYRLTLDNDSSLTPLKLGQSFTFRAGGRMWTGTRPASIAGASADGTDMTYTLTDAAVTLLATGAALKAVAALVF